MPRKFQKPEVTIDTSSVGGEVHDHPAFGMIGASRCTGSATLFGSELKHNGYVAIRIKRASKRRSLSRAWFHGKREIVEVLVSEAQWATFVSAMNIGDGVPCTIAHVDHEQMPEIPPPDETHHDTFAREIKATLQNIQARIAAAIKTMPTDGPMSKTKLAALAKELGNISSHLTSNTHFIAEQFQEHMENVTEKAKIEVNAFVTGAIQRAGLEALREGKALPVEMPERALLPPALSDEPKKP